MRGKEFKRIKSVLGVVLLATLLICTMVIPPAVTAMKSRTIPGLGDFTITKEDLSEGDVINYDWYTPNGEDLVFWIEDEGGNGYKTKQVSGSSGSFEVKSNGDWYVKWSNLNSKDVELEYDVTVESAENDTSTLVGYFIILVVLITIVVGLLLYYMKKDYEKEKEKEELKESQQTQQQPSAPPSQSQQQQPQQPQQAPRQPQQSQPQQAPPPPAQGSSTQQTQQQDGKPCPECDTPMRYVEQYERWYCDNCGKYQ